MIEKKTDLFGNERNGKDEREKKISISNGEGVEWKRKEFNSRQSLSVLVKT
jgi:hypothetical protein